MIISEIQSYIGAVERDPALHDEKNFHRRAEVIDFIGSGIMDRIGELLPDTDRPGELIQLGDRAGRLRSELEGIDARLFHRLRAEIRAGACRGEAFKAMIGEYVGSDPDEAGLHSGHCGVPEETGYDNLDAFVNGLTCLSAMPEQTKELGPEMVGYHKTPARVVLELVSRLSFTGEDVFFDLGSGLGQAAILVNLLTGIRARGVEFEPAFCDYARGCAAALNLSGVSFLNTDARKAGYSGGTVFFMFTPFTGRILDEVLEVLRKESLRRKIRIVSYGPCTARVAGESWLDAAGPAESNEYKLAVFSS